jgi:hypothetical protein
MFLINDKALPTKEIASNLIVFLLFQEFHNDVECWPDFKSAIREFSLLLVLVVNTYNVLILLWIELRIFGLIVQHFIHWAIGPLKEMNICKDMLWNFLAIVCIDPVVEILKSRNKTLYLVIVLNLWQCSTYKTIWT